ncbi:CGNR zinc finger domain-containing protein [Spongiactinospora rosea]|uniref:CGNR zinc finger domain-containing protein n=1 Tax=Spongiactinospora rosea TaxID=2248750 RepID=UPI001CEDF129|nr:ABATE domain-containing protein [Spongiactinospora rosea]
MTEYVAGLILHTREGVAYRFDPGALCLELLPTGGPGRWARYEVLHTPADLAAWAGRSRLRVDPALVEAGPADVERARALRDALWRLTSAHVREETAALRPPSEPAAPGQGPDVEIVNAMAAVPSLAPRIEPGGDFGWGGPITGERVLASVARDAVELFTGPAAGRVRECASDNCHLIFVDTSRPGRRRWCAMEHCGNRHKVRAHRGRA